MLRARHPVIISAPNSLMRLFDFFQDIGKMSSKECLGTHYLVEFWAVLGALGCHLAIETRNLQALPAQVLRGRLGREKERAHVSLQLGVWDFGTTTFVRGG